MGRKERGSGLKTAAKDGGNRRQNGKGSEKEAGREHGNKIPSNRERRKVRSSQSQRGVGYPSAVSWQREVGYPTSSQLTKEGGALYCQSSGSISVFSPKGKF